MHLSLLTAQFLDSDTERAFRTWNAPAVALHTRIGLLLYGLIFFAFLAIDLVSGFSQEVLLATVLVRVAVLVVGGVVLVRRWPTPQYAETGGIFVYLFVSATIVFVLLAHPVLTRHGASLVVLVGTSVAITGVSLRSALLIELIATPTTWGAWISRASADFLLVDWLLAIALPVVGMILGLVFAYWLNIRTRSGFSLLADEMHVNMALAEARHRAEMARQQLEDTQHSLVEARKMAALGELVAGVAHEINTPLGIIVTASSHIRDRTEELGRALASNAVKKVELGLFVDAAVEAARMVNKQANRIAALVERFKKVAEGGRDEPRRPVVLAHAIRDTLAHFTDLLHEAGHKVEVECTEDLVANVPPEAFSQILIHLLSNSLLHAYAIGESGTIRVAATPKAGNRIALTLSDNGKGIPAENLARIFNPFFTTRRGGKDADDDSGTGLGLHIVYNLVHHGLGGEITAHSTLGQGAAFTVTFPTHL